jgi:putative ABC transport system permease protein
MPLEGFKAAFTSLWSNKLRSFLTLLGIVIGIYAVVILLAIAQGIKKQTTDLVEGFGPRTMTVIPGEPAGDEPNLGFAAQFAPSTLFVDDVEELKEKGTLIEEGVGYLTFVGGLLRKGETRISGFPAGYTAETAELFNLTLEEGRFITQRDLVEKRRVIILSQTVAEKLEAGLDDTVFIGAEEFTIVGTFSGPEIVSFGPGVDDYFLFPATVANEINQSNQVNRIIVYAIDPERVEEARDEVISILAAKRGGAVDFSVLLPKDILSTVGQIIDILKYAVVGIAAISLLVGGIGISNIMLVTVTERTREIGIRKAVGATDGAILTQFLIEAVILTIVGALIAIGLAGLTAIAIARFSPLVPSITSDTILLAITMGAVAGIVFGLFPALRAARRNPVEALRFE